MYQEVSGRGITAADTTQSEVDAHYDQVKAIFDVLNGKKEADLLLKNLNILDVHSESVYRKRSFKGAPCGRRRYPLDG